MDKKAVVLLSGGLDSAVALAFAGEEGFVPYPLTFCYGQNHISEVTKASMLAQGLPHRVMRLKLFGGSSLLGEGKVTRPEGVPPTWVPARNLIFLSLASSYAKTVGAHHIYIGVNIIDYSGYPDCRPEFIAVARHAICEALDEDIVLRTPLLYLSKAEIIKAGMRLGVDFAKTHSCYFPDERGRPCGKCDSCKLRAKGFKEAGMKDPAMSDDTQNENGP